MLGLTSLQVCMDSADWLDGPINEETGMDSSSPSGDMLTCTRPTMIERRLRPPHDQALNCPRCDSTHTKFCYYNNYSLSQPRYFCKTCRRYWTKGGTLRNIPVGGGCRKNKKVAKKSGTNNDHHHQHPLPINHISLGSSSSSSSHHNTTDLQLSFPDQVQFSHLNMLHTSSNPNFMDTKYDIGMLKNPGSSSSSSRNFEFTAISDQMGTVNCFENQINHHTFQGLCPPYGISGEGNTGAFMGTSHRLMLPYDHQENTIDVKPNTKLLSLEWQEQGHESCSNDGGKDTYGYLRNFGSSSWTGMMNDYGSSTANIL